MGLIRSIEIGIAIDPSQMGVGLGKATSSLKSFNRAAEGLNGAKWQQSLNGKGADQLAASFSNITRSLAGMVPGLNTALSVLNMFKGSLQAFHPQDLAVRFSGAVMTGFNAGLLKAASAITIVKLGWEKATTAFMGFVSVLKTLTIQPIIALSKAIKIIIEDSILMARKGQAAGDQWYTTIKDIATYIPFVFKNMIQSVVAFRAAIIQTQRAILHMGFGFRDVYKTLVGFDWKGAVSGIWGSMKSGAKLVLTSIASTFKLVAGAGAAAGVAVAAVFAKGAAAAAQYNSQVTKSQLLFGPGGSKALTQYAEQQAKQFGIVKTAALDSVNAFTYAATKAGQPLNEALQTGMKLADMAKDMAAAAGTSVDQAATAIRAGLRGEADPLEIYGVVLKESAVQAEAARMGLKGLNGELSEQEKFMARISLLGKETKPLEGMAGKTGNTALKQMERIGNTLENIWVDIGLAVQPVTDKVLQFVSTGLTAISEWVSANKDGMKEWFQAFVTGGNFALGLIDMFANSLALIVDTGRIIGKIFASVFTGIVAGVLKVGKAIGLVSEEMSSFADQNFLDSMSGMASLPTLKAWQGLKDKVNAPPSQPGGKGPELGAAGKTQFEVAANAAKEKNFQVGKSIEDYTAKLKEQVATTGVAADTAEVYKLKQMGATDVQLAAIKTTEKQVEAQKEQAEAKKELDQYIKTLKEEAATAGLADSATKLYQLKLKGASEEQLKSIEGLQKEADVKKKAAKDQEDLVEKAKKVAEETRTPLKFYQDEMKALRDMANQGLISPDQLVKGEKKVFEDATEKLPKGAGEQKLASAMESGSSEAANYQAKILSGVVFDKDKEDLKNGREQLLTQRLMLGALNKVVGMAVGGVQPLVFAL